MVNFLATWVLRLMSVAVLTMAMTAGGICDMPWQQWTPRLSGLAGVLFVVQAGICLVLRFSGCIYFLVAYAAGACVSFHVLASYDQVYLLGAREYGTWLAVASSISGLLLGTAMRMDTKL